MDSRSPSDQFSLVCHPRTSSGPVQNIEVDVTREANQNLIASFALRGQTSKISIPPTMPQRRQDELWQHTCFEVFLRSAGGSSYFEFNLSPSSAWAAYRFEAYRKEMTAISQVNTPLIVTRVDAAELALVLELDLSDVAELASNDVWEMALATVVETTEGDLSYWALNHPSGDPDFHHTDCFRARLTVSDSS